jgi:hypothetical protein
MFHSDRLAVNALACHKGALQRKLLEECARGRVPEVSGEAYLAGTEQVTNGFYDLAVVARLVTDRLNELEQRDFGALW